MECESGTEAAQHAPEKVPRVGVGWRGGSLVAWCLGQSGAEGPHSVLMVLALAAWTKAEEFRNGKDGGIPPMFFQRVRKRCGINGLEIFQIWECARDLFCVGCGGGQSVNSGILFVEAG